MSTHPERAHTMNLAASHHATQYARDFMLILLSKRSSLCSAAQSSVSSMLRVRTHAFVKLIYFRVPPRKYTFNYIAQTYTCVRQDDISNMFKYSRCSRKLSKLWRSSKLASKFQKARTTENILVRVQRMAVRVCVLFCNRFCCVCML